jgi:hypothetical protein
MVRVRIEMALVIVAALLAIVALVWPTWIESLFGISPDGGSGETEWWLVIAFAAAAGLAALLAWREYRSINHASSSAIGGSP